MKLDARLLNLLGLLVIVGVLAIGTTTVALPMYEGVRNAQSEIATDQSNNDSFRLRLTELDAAEQRQGEIETSIESLRAQLPSDRQSESALQAIENALVASGAALESASYAAPVPFAPRADVTGGAEAASTDAAVPPESSDGTDASASADAASSSEADGSTDAAASSSEPRQQFEITLAIGVADEAAALTFLDAVRSDSRIMVPVEATLAKNGGTDGGLQGKLDVKLLVFFYDNGSNE